MTEVLELSTAKLQFQFRTGCNFFRGSIHFLCLFQGISFCYRVTQLALRVLRNLAAKENHLYASTPPRTITPTIQISVIDESTVLTDAEVTPVVIALQQQVTNDFRPIWGIDPNSRWSLRARNRLAEAGGSSFSTTRPGQGSRISRSHPRWTSHRQGLRRQRLESERIVDRHRQPSTAGDAGRPQHQPDRVRSG